MGRTILLIFCLALLAPFAVKAQEQGAVSVFGGYSASSELLDPLRHGWNASIAGNITKHLALFTDFSRYSGRNAGYQFNSFNLMFGPRYVGRIGKRWAPFAHALFGLYTRNQNQVGSLAVDSGLSNKKMFAMGGGCGIDVAVNKRFSMRLLQFDVVGSRDGHWGYGRTSFGAVFRLSGEPR
jgi:hypothetical protein